MNYRFFKDTASLQFITNFNQDPDLRPKVNDIVSFPPNRTQFVITREVPISTVPLQISIQAENGNNIIAENGNNIVSEGSAATANGDVSFDFFVRRQDTSYDTVSLRGSNDNVMRQLFRL